MDLTRRTFLKGMGAAGAVAALGVHPLVERALDDLFPPVPETDLGYEEVEMGNVLYRVFPEQLEAWNEMLGWPSDTKWVSMGHGTYVGRNPIRTAVPLPSV